MDAKRVVEFALSQIGTAEDPLGSNKQKYGAYLDSTDWYLYKDSTHEWRHLVNGYDWCTQFVDASFCMTYSLDEARKMLYRPKYNNMGAVVKYAFNYFKSAGRGYTKEEYSPKSGDVIYFQNSKGLSHTGIVVEVTSSQVITVEGNAGKNCWYVAKGAYSKTSSYIYGYGHPNYTDDPDPKEMDGYKVGNTYEVVCTDPLAIRKGAGTSYPKKGELHKGDKILCNALQHDAKGNTWMEHKDGWSCAKIGDERYIDEPQKNGWIKVDGKWYYYDHGVKVTSDWVDYKGEMYYMGSDGAMYEGWKDADGEKRYFYRGDGHMAYGEWIDGLYLDMDGAQRYPHFGKWRKNDKGWWFEDERGRYPKNRCMRINMVDYQFDKSGYLIEK